MDVSQDFDPYYNWLGIPPSEQPPDHYQLLGVSRFESDAKILLAAAEQRFVYLRTFQLSPHSRLAERLLNEVAAAKVCLLDPKKKAHYDTKLQDALAAAVQVVVPPPAPPPMQVQASPLFRIEPATLASTIAARLRRGNRAQNQRRLRIVLLLVQIAFGCLFGLAAGCFLLSLAYPNHPILVAVRGFFHAEAASESGSQAPKTAPAPSPVQVQPRKPEEQSEPSTDIPKAKEPDPPRTQGPTAVATLEHYAKPRKGRKSSLTVLLLSDGHVHVPGQPAGTATWEIKGSTLTIRWNDLSIDICTLSKDGRSYDGHSQRKPNIHVWGKVLSGDVVPR